MSASQEDRKLDFVSPVVLANKTGINLIIFIIIFVENCPTVMERKQSSGFCRILIVAFLLFLAPAGGSNPAGQLLTLT